MRRESAWKKGRLAALITASAVILSGAVSPLTPAMAEQGNPANVETWEELKAAIDSRSPEITITKNLVATGGQSLDVDYAVTIQGDATIFRDSQAQSYNSMFNVKDGGSLTLGGSVQLSGKAGTCGESAISKQTSWVQHATDEKFKAVEGKTVMFGFKDIDRDTAGDQEGVAYIGDNDLIYFRSNSDIFDENNGQYTLKDTVDRSRLVFTVSDVDDDDYQAARFTATDGRMIGKEKQDGTHYYVKMVNADSEFAYKIENEVSQAVGAAFKFSIAGTADITGHPKYIFPRPTRLRDADVGTADQVLVQGQRAQAVNYGSHKEYLWVEEERWVVDGAPETFDSEEAALAWLADNGGAGANGAGECECSVVTGAQFNGARGNEKGFFVQVAAGGSFTLQDEAQLRDLITDDTVTYAAPIVSKGGTVAINGGAITHNSVGYSANNADSGLPAEQIGAEASNGWDENGKNAQYANTETAGAIILTENATGVVTGGDISGNRGDTGAIVVQGKPDRDRSAGRNTNVENGTATPSSLDIRGGALDNNVGVHHAGAVYSFNGAGVEMSGGAITNNFAWNKGGAVWVSEESYASGVWASPSGTPSNLPVGEASFIFKGGTISGNMAVHRGGAIEVMSDHVALLGGEITSNYSRVIGGAVYVEGDGVDRMYQLYIDAGCITGNSAVPDSYSQVSAPLYRTLSTAEGCDFSNEMTEDSTKYVFNRNGDFGHYYGHGGGIWLCPFGGNTTFAVPNSQVVVTGNNADSSSLNNWYPDGDGKDMLVRPVAAGKLNAFNFLDLGPENIFTDERTGTIFSNDTVQGKHYSGSALALTNTKQGATCGANGVKISNNVATDGGGIASNGTIVFGDESDVYQAITSLKLTKKWSDSLEKQPVTLNLYAQVGGTRVELPGYSTTLNGTADSFVSEGEGELEENQYNENSTIWESEAWVAEMGMPLTVVVNGEVVPLFTFKDGDAMLDPSNMADLKTIYEKVKNGQLTAANAKVSDWKLVVEEKIADVVQENVVDLGSGKVESLTAHDGDITEFKDLAGHIVGRFGVYPVEMNFASTIGNDITPSAEKYVNKDVHSNIVEFDKEFTYDVLAYVPLDATKVTITDTLLSGLEFADADGAATTNASDAIQSVVVKATNNHKAGAEGTVSQQSSTRVTVNVAEGDKHNPATIDSSTLNVTIDREQDLETVRGKWIQLTFNARIKDDYRTIDALKALTNTGGAKTWQEITANAPVQSDSQHEGMANKATYTAFTPANTSGSTYETNTVTITPETTKLRVEKKWNVNGSAAWPENVETVTFGVFANFEKVREVTLNAQKTSVTVEGLPKLQGVIYTAKEIKVNGEDVTYNGSAQAGRVNVADVYEFIANTIKEVVENIDQYTTTNSTPQVEKYVNNTVHADLDHFDDTFEYSVMAYVPEGATQVEISDTLPADLLFVDVNGNLQGTQAFDANNLVTNSAGARMYGLIIESSNDHKVNGTVKGHTDVSWFSQHPEQHLNGPILGGGIQLSQDGKTITVTVTEDQLNANGRQIDAHGKWIVLSFRAAINPASYDAVIQQIEAGDEPSVTGLSWQKVSTDKTVRGGTTPHAGVDNTAKYKVYVGNEGTSDYETNTVTVKPKTTTVSAKKAWLNPNGTEADWPEDVESVTVNVRGVDNAVVSTLTLSEATPEATTVALPVLDGVTYTVDEVDIPGYQQYGSVTGAGTTDDPYLFTNRKVGGPQIEKYVNEDVHQNLVEFDKPIKYDILAFVPTDAEEIIIKDTLVNALEFADANGHASTTAGDVVTGVVAKADNNHTVGGTVSEAGGTALGEDATVTVSGKDLTVRVPDATSYQGQWIQVTFYAKYTQAMIDAANVGNSQTVTGNGTVLQGANTHTGTANTASYDIRVDNDWTQDIRSNTVTVTAEKVQLSATKNWQDVTGSAMDEWPADVSVTFALMKGTTEIETKTLSGAGTVTFTAQPKLQDVTYTVTEKSVTGIVSSQVGDPTVTGDTWTFTNKLSKFDVPFSKREFGESTDELPGAKIRVTDSEGTLVEEWTSGDTAHVLKLSAGDYVFEEVNAPVGFDKITTTVSFTVAADGSVSVTSAVEDINGRVTVVDTNHLVLEDMPKPTPAIEKYVNKDVHSDIVNFDQEFTYDIMARVSNKAHSVEVYDTLVDVLEFADANGNASVDADAVILSVTAKDANNHKANGSVSGEGTPVDGYTAVIEDGKLTVRIEDATAIRGKWLQVTFNARIKDEYRTLESLSQQKITDNAPVISDIATHMGVPNTASYIEFDNAGGALDHFIGDDGNAKPEESNTVTVVPETTKVMVVKTWYNAEDWELEKPISWPRGAVVTLQLMNGDEVIATDVLTADKPFATFTDLPKLKGAEYVVVEAEVDGVFSLEGEPNVVHKDDGSLAVELVNRLLPTRSEMFVEVTKVNENGDALAGAQLKVTGVDGDGNSVDLGEEAEWTTDGANHRLVHLRPGTYTLSEVKAPAGYQIAEPITFEVTLEGTVKVGGQFVDVPVLTMTDKPVPPSGGDKSLVDTGSPAGIALIVTLALLGGGAGALALRRYRNR